jgi:hypothetical protein
MRSFSNYAAFLLALIFLLPLPTQAQATAHKYTAPFDVLPSEQIEKLNAPFLEVFKNLSVDDRAHVKQIEIDFMQILIPTAETINLSERLRICRGKIELSTEYDEKIEKITVFNKKGLRSQTNEFFSQNLFKADYIDPKILRDHLLADQMIQLQVNQNVIIASLGSEKFDAPSCYRLRDKIDQYLIDNDISRSKKP